MEGRLRINVLECDDHVIFEHYFRRDLFFNYFAENAELINAHAFSPAG